MMSSILEEFSGLPTGRRIEPLPTEGMGLSSHNIDRFTYPSAATIRYSAASTCHDIDIEGVTEERVVEGDDELYIQRNSHHIHLK